MELHDVDALGDEMPAEEPLDTAGSNVTGHHRHW